MSISGRRAPSHGHNAAKPCPSPPGAVEGHGQTFDRALIERALSLPGDRRSDYDLNPEVKRSRVGAALRPAAVLCPIVERSGASSSRPSGPTRCGSMPARSPFPAANRCRRPDARGRRPARSGGGDRPLPALVDVLGRIDPCETGTGCRACRRLGRPGLCPRARSGGGGRRLRNPARLPHGSRQPAHPSRRLGRA